MSCLRPGGLELTLHALSFSHIDQFSRILDLGCGNGESLALIRQKYDCFVAGLEPDQERLCRARIANPGVEISSAHAEDIPFAEDSFDIVLSECAFSLFSQPSIALTEISRVLAANGSLILTDVYAKNCGDISGAGLLRHLYTIDEFTALLGEAGFSVSNWQDCANILKTMLAQLILEYGAAEAYKMVGLDQCRLRAANVGYLLLVAKKENR